MHSFQELTQPTSRIFPRNAGVWKTSEESVLSDNNDNSLPSHAWQSQEQQDIQTDQFKNMLRRREQARIAYHQADNDSALRRAMLSRRPCPHRGHYPQGSWVKTCKTSLGKEHWSGPQRAVLHPDQSTVWTTVAGRLSVQKCSRECPSSLN